MPSTQVRFLGGAGTVTGSMYLVERGGTRILIDCGQFQGYKKLRLRNWEPFPFDPSEIDAVLLTHAHLDHSGLLPRLYTHGYKGPIFATAGTRDLARLILTDSGSLQEEDARYLNKHGLSKHKPAKPLYTKDDAQQAVRLFETKPFGKETSLDGGFSFELRRAGHIVGAASVHLRAPDGSLLVSGDLGRPDDTIMQPPVAPPDVDALLMESTYGDRLHQARDVPMELAEVLNETFDREGVVLIPAFAVGRAQELLILLQRLEGAHKIPDVPVFLDSPMAIDATDIYCEHAVEHRLSPEECKAMCRNARFVQDREESKGLDRRSGPMVIIAGSGMMTGGRILHHVKVFGGDRRNTILIVGYQAGGTRGSALLSGQHQIKIHGQVRGIRARVVDLAMSAHADQQQLMDWLESAPRPPRRTFLVHGEDASAEALRHRIQDELHHDVRVAEDRSSFDLGALAEKRHA